MVERERRFNTARAKSVHDTTVEIEALLVGRPPALRLDAGPRYGESVGADTQFMQEVEILVQSVVVITGHVTGVAVPDGTESVTEGIPNGRTATVGGHGSFNLVARRGRAPEKARREGANQVLRVDLSGTTFATDLRGRDRRLLLVRRCSAR